MSLSWKRRMAAIPEAPARLQSMAFSSVTPPSANTGMFNFCGASALLSGGTPRETTRCKPSRPVGGSGLPCFPKTGP